MPDQAPDQAPDRATCSWHFNASRRLKRDAIIEAAYLDVSLTTFCTRAIRDAIEHNKAARRAQGVD